MQESSSTPNQQTHEVEASATFADLDEGITFDIDLSQESNRLIIELSDDYQFST